jgi:uncharacterized membrane protein
MSISKNFYDKSAAPTRNLVTTVTGIITLLLSVLVGFGVITPEQSTELNTHALTIVNAVTGVWGAITAIILMFKATDA